MKKRPFRTLNSKGLTMTQFRRTSYAEWLADGEKLFGKDTFEWKFKCPSCGHIASVKEWWDAGATEGEVAYSCIGRRVEAGDENTFKKKGGPCNYTGGGLFGFNPVAIYDEKTGGIIRHAFEFADQEPDK